MILYTSLYQRKSVYNITDTEFIGTVYKIKATADKILSCIDQWYQQAKSYGWDRAELQWRLNQILEQEPNDNELD